MRQVHRRVRRPAAAAVRCAPSRARCSWTARTSPRWAGGGCGPCAGRGRRSSSRAPCTPSTPCDAGRRAGRQSRCCVHDPAGPRTLRDASDPAVRRRVVELLGQVGLPAWRADSYPHELSGGQKQRVMIAMALACEPQLVITDEATTALDVMVQAQVLTLLRDLVTGRGLAVLMISHDLSVLSSTCDRVVVMYGGTVVETRRRAPRCSRARRTRTVPRCPRPSRWSGDSTARRAPRGLEGDPPDPADLPPGCVFAPRCTWRVDRCTQRSRLISSALDDDAWRHEAACWRSRGGAAWSSTEAEARCPRQTGAAEVAALETVGPAGALRRRARSGTRRRRRRPPGRRRGDRRARWRVRLRQDDSRAHPARPGATDGGPGAARRAADRLPHARPARAPARRAAGAAGPARRAQPATHGLRGGGGGRAHPRPRRRGRSCAAGALDVRPAPDRNGSTSATRTSCPAVSASAWSSPARSCWSPRCSWPTSRWPRSTPRCVARCSRCC